MNIKIVTNELTTKEKKEIMSMIKKLNRKRRHDRMPRLQYKIKLG